MATIIQPGDRLEYTNSSGSTISSGDVVEMGNICGVALADITNGSTGAVAIRGVVTLAAETAASWSQGDQLYWDGTNDELRNDLSGPTDYSIGVAAADKAALATTATVILNLNAAHGVL